MSSDHATRERSKLEVGIAEIDKQHREIQLLLERLKNTTLRQYGYATSVVLSELEIQTRITFAVQESLMRLLSFSDSEAHALEHRQFLDQLEVFRRRSQNFDVSDEISNFIQRWLIDHIQNFDRNWATYFLSSSVNPPGSKN